MNATEARAQHQVGLEVLLLLLCVFVLSTGYFASHAAGLRSENGALTQALHDREPPRECTSKPQEPPLIVLSEAGGYSFPLGSAELDEGFRRAVQSRVVPAIRAAAKRYGLNAIEVVGHSDDVPLQGFRKSTLDRDLRAFISDAHLRIEPADNAGLSMLRAVAVTRLLREALPGFLVLPLSGAQLIGVDGRLLLHPTAVPSDPQRRRIELRLKALREASEVLDVHVGTLAR